MRDFKRHPFEHNVFSLIHFFLSRKGFLFIYFLALSKLFSIGFAIVLLDYFCISDFKVASPFFFPILQVIFDSFSTLFFSILNV